MNPTFNGKINLIMGPMYSGKTSTLLNRYRRYILGGKTCILIKYEGDNRYEEDMVVTHDKIKYDAIKCMYLCDVDNIVQQYDVICIDEIQFYKDAYIFCDKWANNGKIVEVCGLNGTFDRKPFDMISKLIPLCEDITYQTAICKKNGNNAVYSKRQSNNDSEVLIGNMYDAVDRKTYYCEYKDDTIKTNKIYESHELQKLIEFAEIYANKNGKKYYDVDIDKIKNNFILNVPYMNILE